MLKTLTNIKLCFLCTSLNGWWLIFLTTNKFKKHSEVANMLFTPLALVNHIYARVILKTCKTGKTKRKGK